ncbi:MAG: LysM peptidoglycan-binding domain-containing protein [Lachnospiraceae bacterium]|nr:LysM peptidoglycan-binding domain-containing protein [Lachnospiraceae bacterium]
MKFTLKQVLVIAVIVFMVAVGFTLVLSSHKAKASDTTGKTISRVLVQEGDSLWSIASKYYTDEYDSVNSLIDEIETSNHIKSELTVGQYIVVPHY